MAEERGLTFAEEAPELVGKWLSPFDGTDEHYANVIGGKWRTLEFQAFTHGTYVGPAAVSTVARRATAIWSCSFREGFHRRSPR